ncbi:MAG TPA: MBL fold metallo-hydrolase [Burkholderiales bacterium]|jgi:glyoxylase-like metal-dependent hydrolase (beta-lactamase superfamily II)|nr:MBL fold metallo-hydrolase [Burkholderiales bacterium]
MSSIRTVASPDVRSLAKVAWARCGDLEVASLFDGYNDITLKVFNSARPERFVPLLTAAGLPEHPIRASVNSFLVRDEGRNILVDTGMGHYAGPTMGYLTDSLSLVGVAPQDITDVVLTHLHRDHAGGLMTKEETPLFPKAQIHVSRDEFDFWTDAGRMEATPPQFRHFVRIAQTAMQAYDGRVHRMEPTERLTARLAIAPLVGHTPGHSAVWFASRMSRICMWGDMVHSPALQVPAPEITVCFDVDETQARETRRKHFARAADERFVIAGAHLPFPGIGTLAAGTNGGYRFDPLEQL